MSTDSPLFQSSLELLGHSITHFNAGDELDRKLVILHIANSVELLLKDLVLSEGSSIYKNPKETISVHGCISELKSKNVELPYLNKIELLIDERNALQHRFGSPNEITSIFYMNIAVEFFKEVLLKQYNLEFDEILVEYVPPADWHAFIMRMPSVENELSNLKKLAKVHPLGALLSSPVYLENIMITFFDSIGNQRSKEYFPPRFNPNQLLKRLGVEAPKDLEIRLRELRNLRNKAAHGGIDPTKEDVANGLEAITEYEIFLSQLNKVELKAKLEEVIEEDRLAHIEEEEFIKYTGDP